MTISPSATKWLTTAPLIIGILIGAGGVIIALTIISSAGIFNPLASPIPQTEYPSIEIEMPKTSYQVGESLDFTLHTYGICATPNLSIYREGGDGQWVTVYQYVASPFSCPSQEAPDQPHLIWKADQLVQRISDESFGGDGNSVITINAALTLKQVGNYAISASLPDQSKALSMSFAVIDAAN